MSYDYTVEELTREGLEIAIRALNDMLDKVQREKHEYLMRAVKAEAELAKFKECRVDPWVGGTVCYGFHYHKGGE